MKTSFYLLKGMVVLTIIVALFSSCKEEVKTEKAPPAEITVVSVLQKDVPIYKEYVGQTYGIYDIPIRARVQGFLEGIHFNEGSKVHKGDHLYSIDPQAYKANVAARKSDIAQAKTLMVKADSDLKRYKPLAEQNAVSQSDLDNAQAQYDASKAQVDAAYANYELANIELGYTEIYSPIDGIIGKTKAKVGEFVGQNPNPVILNTVSDVSEVNVEFFLTERQYLIFAKEFLAIEQSGEVKEKKGNLELILADGSTFAEKGSVIFIDREINASTGSLLVQARFPNPRGLLRPGQYTKVKIEITTLIDALLIPQRCITELQGQYSVFVVLDNNILESRQITIGEDVGDLRIVKDGLKHGEKIVIDALQKVGTGLEVKPKLIEFESKSNLQD